MRLGSRRAFSHGVPGPGCGGRMRVAVLAALLVSLLPGALVSQVDASPEQIEVGRKKAEFCAAWHGADGNSELTDYPIRAAQTTRYAYLQLKDYKSARRKDEMMNPVAAQLEKQDMVDLAAYYAAQRPKGPRIQAGEGSVPFKPDPARGAAGRKKSAQGLSTMCHLEEFAGPNPVPTMAGQEPHD